MKDFGNLSQSDQSVGEQALHYSFKCVSLNGAASNGSEREEERKRGGEIEREER